MTRDQALVLFDGECSFCNGAVLFIIDRDPKERFVFAPLSSELGKRTLARHRIDPSLDSIVLVEGEQAFTHSTAALRVARHLAGGWSLLAIALLVPRALRDAVYRSFAKRRLWFGRQRECRVPSDALRRRFVT